jgi:hypothetical protein
MRSGRLRAFCAVPLLAAALVFGLIGCGGAQTTSTTTQPQVPPPPTPGPSPTDTISPSIAITAPTASGSYTATAASLSLGGTASDNVSVVAVTWRNSATGATGTASGTSAWSVSNAPLVAGNNIIVVTARDAAGNIGSASLSVSYNPVGPASLAGSVDSSLLNRSGVNAVYLYAGSVVPDDRGGAGVEPVAVSTVTQDNGACTFRYRFDSLAAGVYTLAFTSQAASDNPSMDDAISFVGTTTVTIPASGGTVENFAPTARVLKVGPGKQFAKPSAAAASAQAGDVIEIDAGAYDSDAATWDNDRLTLRGVGGRAHMRSNGAAVQGKGIWVISGNDVVVENIEFSGASVPDLNGAGIRADGGSLTVCNSFFHDNQEGILGGSGNMLIEYSEFARNGNCIDPSGCAHNIYVSRGTQRFTLRYSYSHHAHQGHTVKSRAQENYILYNRIMDEADGDSSYNIDIPDAGRTFIIGNLIQQSPFTDNSTMVAYGAESGSNGTLELYVVNNTFVNDRGSGTFVSMRGGTSGKIVNNIFAGGGTSPGGSSSMLVNSNITSTTPPGLVDRANFDYRLTAASVARDAGTDPGTSANGVSLIPTSQYVHPTNREDRPVSGALDIGAYEFQP